MVIDGCARLRVAQLILNATELRNGNGDDVAVLEPNRVRGAKLCPARPEWAHLSTTR